MPQDSLQIKDSRTGREYEIEITDGTVRALDFRQVKVDEDDFGLMTFDPGYSNTASCRSAITFIDGDKGILRYRGYPIEQLADRFTFLEVAYLIFFGELPTPKQLSSWQESVSGLYAPPGSIERLMSAFPRESDPMAMLISGIAALGAAYPESRDVGAADNRRLQINRLMAQIPAVAARGYRCRSGKVPVAPDKSLNYSANFLNMMFGGEGTPAIDPVLEQALDVLLVLHADHEQNCSTAAMRGIASSLPDPYSATCGAIAALAGPLHGGANAAVLRMLEEIGSVNRIPEYVSKAKSGEIRLMGFGHRVYKNYDPRARIIKTMADRVFQVTGTNPLLEIALELERIALQDDYFVRRKLYPNVDFYSGLIYQAMGFPIDMFTVLFAIGRTVGWLAQWEEFMDDPERRIARPRQIYTGPDVRDV